MTAASSQVEHQVKVQIVSNWFIDQHSEFTGRALDLSPTEQLWETRFMDVPSTNLQQLCDDVISLMAKGGGAQCYEGIPNEMAGVCEVISCSVIP